MSNNDLLLPQNREAEQAVIGSILIDNDVILEIMTILRPQMFYSTANQWAYDAILYLHGRGEPVDSLILIEELRKRGQLEEMGGEPSVIDYISSLMGTSWSGISYAKIVADCWVRRNIIYKAQEMANHAYHTANGDEARDGIESAVRGLTDVLYNENMGKKGRLVGEYAKEIREGLDTPAEEGFKTGIIDLDNLLQGIEPNALVIIAARAGMGKTSFSNEIVKNNAHKLGVYFCLEMPGKAVTMRLISQLSGVDYQLIKHKNLTPRQKSAVIDAILFLEEANIIIDDNDNVTTKNLTPLCRKYEATYGKIDYIMVDYAQLIEGEGRNTIDEMTDVSRTLKKLTKRFNCPVFTLAQVGRQVEARADKRPTLSDLRGSGAFEQDGDIVFFIYRDEYYNPDTTNEPGVVEIEVAKHRNGSTGVVKLLWDGPTMSFKPLKKLEY